MLMLSTSSWAAGVGLGTITGRVLDKQGNPLSDVTVIAQLISRHQGKGRTSVKTNATGQFVIGNSPYGDYVILAANDRPSRDTNAASADNNAMTTISLSSTIPNSVVTLMFGFETSVITGRIKDAVTGQPIQARLQVQSTASGNTWINSGVPSGFHITLPRHSDLSLRVAASGYQNWVFSTVQAGVSTQTVQVKERHKQLSISLQPLK
jgi:hypothetical protein